MEGIDLRTSPRRNSRRSLLLLGVLILAMSSLLPTFSAGAASSHAPVRMPNVIGDSKAQAYAAMAASQLFFVTKGPGSANGSWSSVVGELPAAGTLVPYRSTVTLDVTTAASHEPRPVPKLVGLSRAQVYALMKSYELFFVTKGPGSANGTWKTVVAQSPFADTLVAWHSVVTLTVTTAEAHAPVVVPDLVGQLKAGALALLRVAQLGYHASGPGSATGAWLSVVAQSPKAGTKVPWHSDVTVVVTNKNPSTTTTSTTSTTTTSTTTTTTYPGETTTSTSSTTTTVPPSTTTTVRKTPTTTTTLKPSRARDFRIGIATWYSYIPGQCATWYLPKGIRITVRDLDTGRAISCLVTDREASRGDHVVDLSETQFAELEPLYRGVIHVKVSW